MEGKIITFERSFASHPKAKYWSKLNTFNPNVVHQGANIVAWFECINCNHHFKKPLYEVKRGGWCPYCSGGKTTKLCEDNDCLYCYNKSFKSVPNSKYLLDDTINTRSITKNNTVKMELNAMYADTNSKLDLSQYQKAIGVLIVITVYVITMIANIVLIILLQVIHIANIGHQKID